MATKRGLLDFGAHGKQTWESMGPAGKRRKVREYFTARGKPDDYQYSPEEAREATNYIKAVDKHRNFKDWNKDLGGGSSFLQGASSYDDMYKYKDPIQEFDYPKFLAEQDSETLEEEEIGRASDRKFAIDNISSSGPDLYKQKYTSNLEPGGLLDSVAQEELEESEAADLNFLLDSEELGGDRHDIGSPGENIDETSWWDDLTESSGSKDGKLSPMQKYGAKLITDIFGEKEERPQQTIGASPLTPGRALDMSKYSTSRPKKERYRNTGLLGRA
jgi:hypothetical protein